MSDERAQRGERVASPPDTPEIAASLARAGWPVFPVTIYQDASGKRHKVPAVKWKAEATTDVAVVQSWWGARPTARWIGVYAGKAGEHGIVVLDVDPGGDESLEKAGLDIPPTFDYATHRAGGRHYVYAAPAGVDLTIARGLRYDGHELKGIDVRSGAGLMVYYGPALDGPPKLAPAPDWLLVTREHTGQASGEAADRAPSADEAAFRDRLVGNKPDDDVREVLARVKAKGMTHDDMLAAVKDLVLLGQRGAKGVAAAMDAARATYSRGWPDAGRHWDNAIEGSIHRLGLPPTTLALSKPERKAIIRRNDPDVVKAEKAEKRAEVVSARIVDGTGELTDAALAEDLIDSLRPIWANVPGLGLLRYDGVIWKPTDVDLLVEHVRRMVRVIRAEETKLAILRGDAKREGEAKALESRTRIVHVARFVAGMLLEDAPQLDADPDVLNVQNGVVDLRTGELRERVPTDYFTRVAAAAYHPDARSADWGKALHALPKKSRPWLQARLGQATTGRISQDKSIPFLIGGGDNGKSAVLGAVRNALGSYAVTVPERLLLGSDNDHPTDIMTLEGTRLAIFEELPRGGRLNAQRVKLLAGTNRLSGRRMRENFHEFTATHTLVGATNHLPVITDVDDAIWQRVAPVPFPYKFVSGKPKKGTNQRAGDAGLRDRLAENPEPAVLAWLVAGAIASYKSVAEKPKTVLDALDAWRGDADPVLGFVRDRLVIDETHAIASTDLYAEFGRYLEARSQPRWSDQLIASSFVGHSALDGIEKRQVLFSAKLRASRPVFSSKPLPPRAMSFVGVRFVDEPVSGVSDAEAANLAELARQIDARD